VRDLARFAVESSPPVEARARAAAAFLDTVGVALAGSAEPAARAVQRTVAPVESGAIVWGTSVRASAEAAALANGTAAHALDYDDMCFVSLAHPSAPLVPAILAAADLAGASGASGRAALDAYVVGFEIEARLGQVMNTRHYQRGWHCTSTLGTVGAAAGVARLIGLDAAQAAHALGIAASMASGLKENFGSMVKPLHAGLAARNGVQAALLARAGLTANASAIAGAQGYLAAMDAERPADLPAVCADLDSRWEILDTGITVKLYPSCAGTHPTLDVVLDLRAEVGFTAGDVARVEVAVDRIAPTILVHDRPTTGLEAKFSMPYCVAAAVVHGRVGLDTFDDAAVRDPQVTAFLPRVTMAADPAFDSGAPALTQSRVRIRLKDGREVGGAANGARGYPERPPSEVDVRGKFLSCASRALPADDAERALGVWTDLAALEDVGIATGALRGHRG
jgi:2-methylcitrate dehydratase PrpD